MLDLQEKQLRVNMGVAKLREKVKQQQQKVERTVRERLEKNQEYFKKNVKEMTDNVSDASGFTSIHKLQ